MAQHDTSGNNKQYRFNIIPNALTEFAKLLSIATTGTLQGKLEGWDLIENISSK